MALGAGSILLYRNANSRVGPQAAFIQHNGKHSQQPHTE
jgi:hypothetical protein